MLKKVHKLRWSSPEISQKYSDVDISNFDAATETAFADPGGATVGSDFYNNVILPDERRFLFSEATKHMVVVEPGTVVGDRVEFIIDGNPVVEFGEWQTLWDELSEKGKLST